MAQPFTNGPQVEPHDSLYTSLVIISAVTLLIGIVVIIVQSINLFGSVWPAGTAS
jgi:hypothetical protein